MWSLPQSCSFFSKIWKLVFEKHGVKLYNCSYTLSYASRVVDAEWYRWQKDTVFTSEIMLYILSPTVNISDRLMHHFELQWQRQAEVGLNSYSYSYLQPCFCHLDRDAGFSCWPPHKRLCSLVPVPITSWRTKLVSNLISGKIFKLFSGCVPFSSTLGVLPR